MSEGGLGPAAAACLFPGFEGEVAPEWIRGGGFGGVVLFARNIREPEQLSTLTSSLEGMVVAVDEEGGDVTRLEAAGGSSFPGNLALGAVDDTALTRRVAAAIGGELAAVGVARVVRAAAVDHRQREARRELAAELRQHADVAARGDRVDGERAVGGAQEGEWRQVLLAERGAELPDGERGTEGEHERRQEGFASEEHGFRVARSGDHATADRGVTRRENSAQPVRREADTHPRGASPCATPEAA
jgi:hypothetical protein